MDASWSCPGGTDHYLDVLARKPGAVACARALKPNILSLLWQEYLAALKSTQPQPEQEFVHTFCCCGINRMLRMLYSKPWRWELQPRRRRNPFTRKLQTFSVLEMRPAETDEPSEVVRLAINKMLSVSPHRGSRSATYRMLLTPVGGFGGRDCLRYDLGRTGCSKPTLRQ